jgi:hypothetical protein
MIKLTIRQSAHFRNYCALYTVLTRTLFLTEQKVETHKHRLKMELDLQSLFGLHVYSCAGIFEQSMGAIGTE